MRPGRVRTGWRGARSLAFVALVVLAGFGPGSPADPATAALMGPPSDQPPPPGVDSWTGPWRGLPPDQVIEQQTTPPADARTRAAQGARRVGIVSDSMGYDAGGAMFDAINKNFPVVYNNSIAGGRVRDHTALVLDAVEEPDGPEVLLVILGTAEAQWDPTSAEWEADVRDFLDRVTPHVDCVRWFDTQHRDAHHWWGAFNRNHRRFNAILSSVAAEYDRVEDVHYSMWTELAPPEFFEPDRLHLNWDGRRAMAPLAVQAVAGCEEDTNVAGFWDVKEGHWAEDAIAWSADAGLVSGYPNHTYRAEVGTLAVPVTRGQITSMLWRLEGSPSVATPHPWRDGPRWLDPALRWLHSEDTAGGYPNGTFRPDRSMLRGQFAVWLWRDAGRPEATGAHPWSDGAPWLDPALDWLAETGLVNGFPNGTFRPDEPIDRAQIATWMWGVTGHGPA